MNRDQKVLVISHNDLDGFGATIVAKAIFGYNVDVYNMGNLPDHKLNDFYDKVLKEMEEDPYDTIFIVDLRVPVSSAKKMDEYNTSHGITFYVCDHHKSSLELIEESYEWCYILSDDKDDTDHPECGTSIFYDVVDALHHDEHRWPYILDESKEIKGILYGRYTKVKNFINLVRLWDTYAWENEKDKKLAYEAKLLHRLFVNTSAEYISDLVLNSNNIQYSEPKASDRIIPRDVASLMESIEEHEVNMTFSRMKKCAIERYMIIDPTGLKPIYFTSDISGIDEQREKVKCIIMIDHTSPAAMLDVINRNYTTTDLLIEWDPQGRKISLRSPSKSKFDCGKFALECGGGGHRAAAGISYMDTDPEGKLFELLEELKMLL